MAADDDRPIDDAVVEIKPDFTGFRQALRDGVKRSSTGVKATIGLTLDKSGFRNDLVAYLKGVNAPKVKVGIDLDSRGLTKQLANLNVGNLKVGFDVDATGLRAKALAATRAMAPINIKIPAQLDIDTRFLRQRVQAAVAGMSPIKVSAPVNVGVAARGAASARREVNSVSDLMKRIERNRIIDWGGRGIRPLNLLRGAAVALIPALISMGSEAAFASTGLAALGSAAIGTAGLITSVTLAFGSITDYMKQLKAAQQAERQEAASGAAVNNTLARSVDEVRLAEMGLHDSRVQAKRDLEDLIERQSDLARQTRRDTLDVAEARAARDATVRNFFASDLERRQAQADLQEAIDRQSDTRRDLRRTREDLTTFRRRGIEGQPSVISARMAVADNRAQAAGGGAGAPAAAATQLAYLRSQLSPAAREFADFLDANQKKFTRLRHMQEQAVLPGFLSFMRSIMDTRGTADGKSALDLMAEGAANLGGRLGKLVATIGKWTKTNWFRGGLYRINEANAESFDHIADAAEKLFKPLWRILVASAPLAKRFTGYLEDLATRFAKFMDGVSDADLVGWFRDAGDRLAAIWRPFENVIVSIFNIMKAAAPGGDTLWKQLGDLTERLRNWSSSAEGQQQIKAFFDYFANADYGKIKDIVVQAVTVVGLFKAGKYAANHPVLMLLAAFATAYPDATLKFLQLASQSLMGIMQYAVDHPDTVIALTALIAAYKGLKAISGFKFPSFPGLPKWLGGGGGAMTVATMTVHATNVTIVGGGAPGTGGTPPVVTPGGPGGKPPTQSGRWAKLGRGAGAVLAGVFSWPTLAIGVGTGVVFELAGQPYEWDPVEDAKNGWKAFQKTLKEEMAGATWDEIKSAWNSLFPDTSKPQPGGGPRNSGGGTFGTPVPDPGPLVNAFGQSKAAAEGYRDEMEKLQEQSEKADTATSNFSSALLGTKQTAADTLPELDRLRGGAVTLKESLDKATGKRTITVTMGDTTKVFKSLQEALVFQRSLQTGLSLGAAAQAVKRDEEATRRGLYGHAATGGHIIGAGTRTSDSIPTMLSNGEWVHPTAAVDYYGHGVMTAMQKREIPKELFVRRAQGGPVGTWRFPVDISKTRIPAPTGYGPGVATGDPRVSETAEATARAMGATSKQLLALIEAGLVESGLRNLTYGDRDSVGFLQQRASWGSLRARMDVATATRKFISKARRVDNARYSAGQLAQAVQVSAFPDRYDRRQGDAIAVLNRAAPFFTNPAYLPGGPSGTGTQAGLIAFGRWLQQRGYDVSEHPAFGGVRGGHVNGSKHYVGRAFDVNAGAGTSAREQRLLAKIIPEAHRRGLHTIFMSRGHYNHAHVDYAQGGPVGQKLVRDGGGTLPRGLSLVYNGTGAEETVRTRAQERQLAGAPGGGTTRLDRRDLALLAQYITAAQTTAVAIDGREVARAANKYTPLPGGF